MTDVKSVVTVENIVKNLQSFLEISPMEKEVLPSYKLWDHAYEYWNPFRLKEDDLLQRKIARIIWVIQVCFT